jgi:MFS family permease
MTGCLAMTYGVSSLFPDEEGEEEGKDEKKTTTSSDVTHAKTRHVEFDGFRREYMMVYYVIMLADWMQGTHMYTLYLSYNVNISALFLTGFLSGAIFAPFLGSAVDKFGRKRSCIVYCVLEIIINTLEHSQNFIILLIGRILGGISTNLLFSAFESWMVTQVGFRMANVIVVDRKARRTISYAFLLHTKYQRS